MNDTDDLDIEVFRAGDYGPKGRYSPDDLGRIAADYDAAQHEAPVTVDHAQNGPAAGWVSALRQMGDRLVATLTRLTPDLRAALRNATLRKRSIELDRSFAATGRPYLKAVSFLGAAPPEVKGLRDPLFAEGTEVVRFDEDPKPTGGERAREQLVAAGSWRPEWEREGLLAVFDALDSGAEYDTLLAHFSHRTAPVVLDRHPHVPGTELFGETLAGTSASAESVQLHHGALALLRNDPSLTYRDALLQAAR